MTPFELSLNNELSIEGRRFFSEWTFQWHKLKMEGKFVDVPNFEGGRIHLGGIMFEDQQQSIFWHAISRYLATKVDEVFRRWNAETKEYPAEKRATALAGTAMLLMRTAGSVMTDALRTDRALRGDGRPKTDKPHLFDRINSEIISHIEDTERSYRDLLFFTEKPQPKLGFFRRLQRAYDDNKFLFWFIGIIVGLIGAASRML